MKEISIKKKISNRIILIGIILFLLSLLLSYYIFIPSLKENAIETVENTNEEIVQQMDSVLSFVQDYTENLSLSIAHNLDILRYFSEPTEQNKQIASLQLNNLVSHEGLVRCVIIEKDNVPVLDSLNKIAKEDYQVLNTAWYERLHDAAFGRGTSSVYRADVNNAIRYTTVYLKNFYHSNHRYTYSVYVDLNQLLYDTNVLAGNSLDYYALVDAGGNIFYSNGDKAWQDAAAHNRASSMLNGAENVDGGIRFTKTSINSKWQVVSFISNDSIFSSFAGYITGLVIVLVLFLVMTLAFLSRAMGNIIKPIGNLSRGMEAVTRGNLDYHMKIVSNDEIGKLSQSFNKMTMDLKRSLEIIGEKEKRNQQAKFSLLVSQIDPHFIYNTINSINYLARKGRCDDVITVNSALIYILRDRLRVNDIQITDTIANEIKVLDQYIVIQKYMYEGDLKLQWQVDDELLTEQIPKNMIQPLVENSLFHGLIDEESGDVSGEIKITIKKVDGDIVVKVEDDGLGMDAERLKQVQEEAYKPGERGHRIGLSNIRGRLYYLYGSSDCMQIESKPQKGTCITLTFKKGYLRE